jgi:hypothetical protein
MYGAKAMVTRPTKDMSRFLKLVCDGKDLTELIRRKNIHVLLFVNIRSWGVGDLISPLRTALRELQGSPQQFFKRLLR